MTNERAGDIFSSRERTTLGQGTTVGSTCLNNDVKKCEDKYSDVKYLRLRPIQWYKSQVYAKFQ
jgi:hypothetical protein